MDNFCLSEGSFFQSIRTLKNLLSSACIEKNTTETVCESCFYLSDIQVMTARQYPLTDKGFFVADQHGFHAIPAFLACVSNIRYPECLYILGKYAVLMEILMCFLCNKKWSEFCSTDNRNPISEGVKNEA